jgi:hypothetical protein
MPCQWTTMDAAWLYIGSPRRWAKNISVNLYNVIIVSKQTGLKCTTDKDFLADVPCWSWTTVQYLPKQHATKCQWSMLHFCSPYQLAQNCVSEASAMMMDVCSLTTTRQKKWSWRWKKTRFRIPNHICIIPCKPKAMYILLNEVLRSIWLWCKQHYWKNNWLCSSIQSQLWFCLFDTPWGSQTDYWQCVWNYKFSASSKHTPFWHQGAPLCPFTSQGAPCP